MNIYPSVNIKIIPPATAMMVSIIIVSVAPEIASLTLDASLKRDTISPTLRVPKKFIGNLSTWL